MSVDVLYLTMEDSIFWVHLSVVDEVLFERGVGWKGRSWQLSRRADGAIASILWLK